MNEIINLIIKSAFMDNMVFAYFLGMCSFLAVSKKASTAYGLGLAVIFVLTCTAPLNWLIQQNILKQFLQQSNYSFHFLKELTAFVLLFKSKNFYSLL